MSSSDIAINDNSCNVQLLLWFIFVMSVLTVAARLGTRYAMTRKLKRDYYLILAAQVTYLAQCISISLSASNGLGKPRSELSDATVDSFLKGDYAGVIFLILSLALIKWSISCFIRQISHSKTLNRFDLILRTVIILWVISSTLVSLFGCAIPSPWDYIDGARCINRRAWWTYVVTLNILTDLYTVGLFILLIGKLHITLRKKIAVLSIFFTRLLAVGAAVAQLVVFLRLFSRSDPTYTLWVPIILNQVTLAISTITACAPYLRPFMESLESGTVRVESPRGSVDGFSYDRSGPGTFYLRNSSNSEACSRHVVSE
ncbi:hypothetical protein F4859DRAFT_505579 [Xylaria cf. heliscus]|nr:hypothetical protein F4859DRAFT_505579 [Xylaria cf. heliscus]